MSKLNSDQIAYLQDVLGIQGLIVPAGGFVRSEVSEISAHGREHESTQDTGAFEAAFEEGTPGLSEYRTSGDQNAAKIIVLIANENGVLPLQGETGDLTLKMIQAMKYPASHVFVIEWTHARNGNAPAGVRELLAIEPKPLLIFGKTTASSLMGEIPVIGEWTTWEGARLVATEHPSELLAVPDKKRLAWSHMQTFMKGLS